MWMGHSARAVTLAEFWRHLCQMGDCSVSM